MNLSKLLYLKHSYNFTICICLPILIERKFFAFDLLDFYNFLQYSFSNLKVLQPYSFLYISKILCPRKDFLSLAYLFIKGVQEITTNLKKKVVYQKTYTLSLKKNIFFTSVSLFLIKSLELYTFIINFSLYFSKCTKIDCIILTPDIFCIVINNVKLSLLSTSIFSCRNLSGKLSKAFQKVHCKKV